MQKLACRRKRSKGEYARTRDRNNTKDEKTS